MSRLTPREFEETYIRVFARHKHQVAQLKSAFNLWCESNAVHDHQTSGCLTPHKRSREDLLNEE